MKIFIFLLVSPLVICHSTNRFQSSNYKLTSDPGVVRYFDSISGCATHCVSQGKIMTFTTTICHLSSASVDYSIGSFNPTETSIVNISKHFFYEDCEAFTTKYHIEGSSTKHRAFECVITKDSG